MNLLKEPWKGLLNEVLKEVLMDHVEGTCWKKLTKEHVEGNVEGTVEGVVEGLMEGSVDELVEGCVEGSAKCIIFRILAQGLESQ